MATFETLGEQAADVEITESGPEKNQSYVAGHRRCPNEHCRAHIFFMADLTELRLIATFPAERLDFDARDVPTTVAKALEEAITCHANECYVAAAIMVRKTLEELCHERKASGGNLRQRIAALRSTVVLPRELLAGIDELRLLGDDAAHIESQTFNQIGQNELKIAIDFTKEVLKAVYQYAALLERFRALKPKQDSD